MQSYTFQDQLQNNFPILMDGAMGTELQKLGLSKGLASSLWNLDCPDKVTQTHRAYSNAGAQILFTNTFTMPVNTDLEVRRKILTEGVRLAKTAQPNALIAASIGPFGPRDHLNKLYDFTLDVLLTENIDLICFETLTSLNEARVALNCYLSKQTLIPAMMLFTIDSYEELPTGEGVEAIASCMNQYPIPIVGFNCGEGPASLASPIGKLKKLTSKKLAAKPNAGINLNISDAEFILEMKEILKLGVSLVGGCCGTTPQTISGLRRILDKQA